ncbi:MAG: diaminopimelate epimerase [Candidatus Omnitrophica bacterium]|nr:diaminopimelate epimerase [Candidatus Omnitrophota bacterium]
MRDIEFFKAVASGNDFIIVDRHKLKQPQPGKQIAKLAKQLCQRNLSVGADGLLLIEPSTKCDFKMRVFNPDGSEVDMCGNGARCVAQYASQSKICDNKMIIETAAGSLQAEVRNEKVRIKISGTKGLKMQFDLDVDGESFSANYINTGVPHVVCFAQQLDSLDVQRLGRAIRYHPQFQPGGTNADFVEVFDRNHIRIRTYERGVEQETLACGTGCLAAGIVTAYQMKSANGKHKIDVETQSGEALAVYFKIENKKVNEVFLEGRAEIVYRGNIWGGF